LAANEALMMTTAKSCLLLAVEGLEEGAVSAGLPEAAARDLVRQALAGGAVLMKERGLSPSALKDRVASPAGTTIAGLAALEERSVRGALIRAMEARASGTGERKWR